jgi:hypothetical protein
VDEALALHDLDERLELEVAARRDEVALAALLAGTVVGPLVLVVAGAGEGAAPPPAPCA